MLLYSNLILILVVLAGLGLIQTILAQSNNNGRIVNGYKTSIAKEPYVVSLFVNRNFYCGGSLIAPRLVLSAAHCVEGNVRAENIIVTAGRTYLSRKGESRRVLRYCVPAEYNSNTLHKDAVLLELAKPMTGKNIAIIPLYNGKFPAGTTVKVSGWGLMKENGRQLSNQLRSVKVQSISFQDCENDYQGVAKVTWSMLCATVPDGKKDSCSGDSGGPLVRNGKLVGIVSWGVGCARPRYPGVYTNVAKIIPFIEKCAKRFNEINKK